MNAIPMIPQIFRTDCTNHEKLISGIRLLADPLEGSGIRLLADPLEGSEFHIQVYIQGDMTFGGHGEMASQKSLTPPNTMWDTYSRKT